MKILKFGALAILCVIGLNTAAEANSYHHHRHHRHYNNNRHYHHH